MENPVIFRSGRVILGAESSSVILSGLLKHNIHRYAEKDPLFAEKLLKSFDVDDLVTGSYSVEEAN